MLYALYKCIDVREIQKGKSMKRKKSTQLLAVALTAAMLAFMNYWNEYYWAAGRCTDGVRGR